MKWSGMRLNVVLEGAQGLTVDVRGKVADATTSFAANPITGAADGQKTSLLVADDEALGAAASSLSLMKMANQFSNNPSSLEKTICN
jgi:hypothetical protein